MYLGCRYGKNEQGLLGWGSSYVPDRPKDLVHDSFGMLNHPKQKIQNTKYKIIKVQKYKKKTWKYRKNRK